MIFFFSKRNERFIKYFQSFVAVMGIVTTILTVVDFAIEMS